MDRNAVNVAAAVAVSLAIASCHTTSIVEDTDFEAPVWRRTDEAPRPLAPSATVTEDGTLRFIHPMACQMRLYKRHRAIELRTREPNLATVIVGLATASVGAVILATGIATEDAATTVGGAAGFAVGLPLIVAPFVGTGSSRRDKGITEIPSTTRQEVCGDSPVTGTRAVITYQNTRVAGTIGDEGRFSVPVFAFIDAFDFERTRGTATAELDGQSDSIEWILTAEDLARAVDGFFEAHNIESSVRDLEKVPGLGGDRFAVTLDHSGPYPVAVVSATIRNDGPGTAWGVRARLDSAVPELRNRYMYVGRLAPGQSRQTVLAIPLADDGIDLLTANLQLRLLDAHQTAPNVPLSQPTISIR